MISAFMACTAALKLHWYPMAAKLSNSGLRRAQSLNHFQRVMHRPASGFSQSTFAPPRQRYAGVRRVQMDRR
jgi:hypothetical protein